MFISTLFKHSTLTAGVLSLIGLSSIFGASPSHAAILNGSFENGFNGFSTIGDATIETKDSVQTGILAGLFNTGPTEGNFQAEITNIGGFGSRSGNFAAPASDLETFLGLSSGSLSNVGNGPAVEGAAIKQTFTAKAGDIISFDFNFGTLETPGTDFNDFAFLTLNSDVFKLADTTSTTVSPLDPPNFGPRRGGVLETTSFAGRTGIRTFSTKIQNTGTYTLGIGVVDAGADRFVPSALLVDNIKLTSVPEPASTLGVLTFGALGAGLQLLRKKKQTA